MAFEYPQDLKYLDSHEYVRLEGETATIGISEFAVDQLGDIVFLELPEVGATLVKGEGFGTIESVKAVESLYAPVSGKVVAQNSDLIDAPEELTEDPYGKAWLIKVQVEDLKELEGALSAEAYQALVEGH
jgi:glycine cleavage system H protein